MDKIKVGGDSCYPQHCLKSVHRVTELATLLGIYLRGVPLGIKITLNCLPCLLYYYIVGVLLCVKGPNPDLVYLR